MTVTAAEADEILSRDLAGFERMVDTAAPRDVTHNQFDARVSLGFNIGAGAFSRSTAARNAALGDEEDAADAFLMWDKAGGSVVPGLTKRRQAERAQFLTPDAPIAVSASVPTAAPAHIDVVKMPQPSGWRAALAALDPFRKA